MPREELDRLQWRGETRALAYWVLAATGLRVGELRSITIGAVRLDADPPYMHLEARNEKARRGAQIPLPADLAVALRNYLAERRARLVGDSGASVVAFPGTADGAPLFDVPVKMSEAFNDDLRAAGIAKHDSAGRVVDVHALRHTFGTMLAKAGVSLQVAQKAMRHSTPALTTNIYTHLTLMDTADAVGKLPSFGALAGIQAAEKVANLVTPTVTPNSRIPLNKGARRGNSDIETRHGCVDSTDRISANNDGPLQDMARVVNGRAFRLGVGKSPVLGCLRLSFPGVSFKGRLHCHP